MGDVFGSTACDCHATIEGSMKAIAREGRGALIYLHQTSKGFSVESIGERKMLTFHRDKRLPSLPESERKTQREIGIGAQILVRLESAPHPPAHQPSQKSSSPRRLRHRDRRTSPGAAGQGENSFLKLCSDSPARRHVIKNSTVILSEAKDLCIAFAAYIQRGCPILTSQNSPIQPEKVSHPERRRRSRSE